MPISRKGDARIHARITLPASCLPPIIVVNPNGKADAYIAVTAGSPEPSSAAPVPAGAATSYTAFTDR